MPDIESTANVIQQDGSLSDSETPSKAIRVAQEEQDRVIDVLERIVFQLSQVTDMDPQERP